MIASADRAAYLFFRAVAHTPRPINRRLYLRELAVIASVDRASYFTMLGRIPADRFHAVAHAHQRLTCALSSCPAPTATLLSLPQLHQARTLFASSSLRHMLLTIRFGRSFLSPNTSPVSGEMS